MFITLFENRSPWQVAEKSLGMLRDPRMSGKLSTISNPLRPSIDKLGSLQVGLKDSERGFRPANRRLIGDEIL
jgi:hypothetical protein